MKKTFIIITVVTLAVLGFIATGHFYKKAQPQSTIENSTTIAVQAATNTEDNSLVRPHSPIIGRADAPITIVEFLDPSCESCREVFPRVHKILKTYPNDVRLVVRYAAFHRGSDVAISILEAARKQNMFENVLAALFEKQRYWATHPVPNLNRAWDIAEAAGLNIQRAKVDAASPEVIKILKQDAADIKTNNIRGTPAFFVNGKPVLVHGPTALSDMVNGAVQENKKERS